MMNLPVSHFSMNFFKDLYKNETSALQGTEEDCKFNSIGSLKFRNLQHLFEHEEQLNELRNRSSWYIVWVYCGQDKAMKTLTNEYLNMPEYLDGGYWFEVYMGTKGIGSKFHLDLTEKIAWQHQVSKY